MAYNEIRNCGKALNANLIRGTEGPRGRAKTSKSPADTFETKHFQDKSDIFSRK